MVKMKFGLMLPNEDRVPSTKENKGAIKGVTKKAKGKK